MELQVMAKLLTVRQMEEISRWVFSTSTISANGPQEQSTEVLPNGTRYKTRVPTGFHTVPTQRYSTGNNNDEGRQDHYQGRVVKTIYQNGTTTTDNHITTNLEDVSARYATDGIPNPKKLHIGTYQPTERVQESGERKVTQPNKLTIPTYSTSAQIQKDVIQPKKMDTTRYLQQGEQQTITKETIKPKKVAIPNFQSHGEVKKEVIQIGKLDKSKFQIEKELGQQFIKGPVKTTKLKTEFIREDQEPGNTQWAVERTTQPKRSNFPVLNHKPSSQKRLLKEKN